MKSTKQIKKELHEYIDGITDEKELIAIHDNTLQYLKSDSRKDKSREHDSLPNSQRKILDETINHDSPAQMKRDKEMKRSIGRWFSDGGGNSC